MLPYWHLLHFSIGPLTINTWGFVVSLGFAAAIWMAFRRARHLGLDGNKILDLAFWIMVASIAGARLFHVFFYEWGYYVQHLHEIVRIDQGGLSSFGGFIGATLVFIIFTRRHKLSVWKYADILMFAWPLGHGIGRLGCFLTHMHPGRLSNMPWAVQYPGGARLDMGIIEAIILLIYWFILLMISRRKLPSPGLRPPSPSGRGEGEGQYLVSGMIFYGAARFFLDFFRAADIAAADARYLGLTPAQYGSIILFAAGMYIYWRHVYQSRFSARP